MFHILVDPMFSHRHFNIQCFNELSFNMGRCISEETSIQQMMHLFSRTSLLNQMTYQKIIFWCSWNWKVKTKVLAGLFILGVTILTLHTFLHVLWRFLGRKQSNLVWIHSNEYIFTYFPHKRPRVWIQSHFLVLGKLI